jgi:hypothetical protein
MVDRVHGHGPWVYGALDQSELLNTRWKLEFYEVKGYAIDLILTVASEMNGQGPKPMR